VKSFILVTLGIVVVLIIVVAFLIFKIDTFINSSDDRNSISIIEYVKYKFEYSRGIEINKKLKYIIDSGGYKDIIKFFNTFTKNSEVSSALLEESLSKTVPVTWAFSVAWGESSFNPKAIKRNYDKKGKLLSTDRGVMGLSDGHRKDWTIEDFYNIRKNVKEGLSYFKQSIDEHDNHFVFSVAGYNAGIYSIVYGIGYNTLKYITNVTEFEADIEVSVNFFLNDWKAKID
jgi:hypothetical protein